MGRCLRVVSRDAFMLVIYCLARQALLRELLWGPAHSVAPCGNSSLIWQDCLIYNLLQGGRWGNVVGVLERRYVDDTETEKPASMWWILKFAWAADKFYSVVFVRVCMSSCVRLLAVVGELAIGMEMSVSSPLGSRPKYLNNFRMGCTEILYICTFIFPRGRILLAMAIPVSSSITSTSEFSLILWEMDWHKSSHRYWWFLRILMTLGVIGSTLTRWH